MGVTKLVAVQFECEKEETVTFPEGWKYIYLKDPETGKYYEPKPGWEVTGVDLAASFVEVVRESV